MDILQKNIEALFSTNIELALDMQKLKDKQLDFEITMGNDPANINLIDKKNFEPMYQGIPIEETLAQLESMEPFKRYPYLYFFGTGNGVLLKMLLKNNALRQLVVFEPNVQIVYTVLNLIDFSQEIKDERLIFIKYNQLDLQIYNSIFAGDAKVYVKVYDLHVMTDYYNKYYHDEILNVNKGCINAIHHAVVSVGNDIKDTIIGLEHFIKNLPQTVQTPTLQTLLKKTANTQTAVIVSTGPSLTKQLQYLKEVQDYVTILCIDASFPILAKYGIKPDIVFTLERVEATAQFYQEVEKKYFEDVIFEITNIAHEVLLDSIKGGTLQLSSRPFGFTRFFSLPEWGFLGSGMSAANMAFDAAMKADFDNIVFIGQDLAYADNGTTHAKDHVRGTADVRKSIKNEKTTAYGGEGEVNTTIIWKMFREFFEKSIYQLKEQKPQVKVINATEGGARIAGTKELPFGKVIEKYVDTNKPKKIIKLAPPEKKLVQDRSNEVVEKYKDVLEAGHSLKEKTESLFLDVAKACETFEEYNKNDEIDEIDYDYIVDLIDKIDELKTQMRDDEAFSKVYMDVAQASIMTQEFELAKVQVQASEKEYSKKAKLVEWIYAHRYWLFSFAGAVDTLLDIFEKEKENILAMEKF